MKTTLGLLPRLSISDGQFSTGIDCLQRQGATEAQTAQLQSTLLPAMRRMPPLRLHLGSLATSASCGTPAKTGPPEGRRQEESVLHRACSRKVLKKQ